MIYRLFFILIFMYFLSGCTRHKSLYRFETLVNDNSDVKICCLITRNNVRKTSISGTLFRQSKMSLTRPGYLIISVYSPEGELLEMKHVNYQSPISHKEWYRGGVSFVANLDINPPENSLIKVAFNVGK